MSVKNANNQTVNDVELRSLNNGSAVARKLFSYLASRKNNASKSTIERLETVLDDGRPVPRSSLIGVLRELEDLGCGQFKIGRRGHPSRMEWAVDVRELGRAAAGDSVNGADVDHRQSLDDELITHRFVMRPDLTIEIELPQDLTHHEAQRLSSFIQSLPFETAEESAK